MRRHSVSRSVRAESIRIFAEVTMPHRGQEEPVAMTDKLVFTLESGVEQSVVLSTVGQDAYIWHGKVIERDTVLKAGSPGCCLRQPVCEGRRHTCDGAGRKTLFP